MVIDILSSDVLAKGLRDSTEDRFMIWAISGLLQASQDIGMEIDPAAGPSNSATERPNRRL